MVKFKKGDLVYSHGYGYIYEVENILDDTMIIKKTFYYDKFTLKNKRLIRSETSKIFIKDFYRWNKVENFIFKPKFNLNEDVYYKQQYNGINLNGKTIVAKGEIIKVKILGIILYKNTDIGINYLAKLDNSEFFYYYKEYSLSKILNYNQCWANLNDEIKIQNK